MLEDQNLRLNILKIIRDLLDPRAFIAKQLSLTVTQQLMESELILSLQFMIDSQVPSSIILASLRVLDLLITINNSLLSFHLLFFPFPFLKTHSHVLHKTTPTTTDKIIDFISHLFPKYLELLMIAEPEISTLVLKIISNTLQCFPGLIFLDISNKRIEFNTH